MSQQIIKQPDGKYAVWSTVVDDIILYDATAKELINYFGKKAERQARRETAELIAKIETSKNPYHQFIVSWDECLNTIKKTHGKKSKIYTELCAIKNDSK
jgi:hypothetical protein